MGGPSGGNSGGNGNNNKTKFGYSKPKNQLVEFVKGGGIVGSVVRGIKEGARKSKANVMDYEGQAAGVTPMRAPFTPDSITFTSPPVPINKHELSMLVVLSIVSLAVTATAIVPKSG